MDLRTASSRQSPRRRQPARRPQDGLFSWMTAGWHALRSCADGLPAPPGPWGASTLETSPLWSLTSTRRDLSRQARPRVTATTRLTGGCALAVHEPATAPGAPGARMRWTVLRCESMVSTWRGYLPNRSAMRERRGVRRRPKNTRGVARDRDGAGVAPRGKGTPTSQSPDGAPVDLAGP